MSTLTEMMVTATSKDLPEIDFCIEACELELRYYREVRALLEKRMSEQAYHAGFSATFEFPKPERPKRPRKAAESPSDEGDSLAQPDPENVLHHENREPEVILKNDWAPFVIKDCSVSPPKVEAPKPQVVHKGRPSIQANVHRETIRNYIRANGPTPQIKLCKVCNVPPGSITAVLKHEWFEKCEYGIQLKEQYR